MVLRIRQSAVDGRQSAVAVDSRQSQSTVGSRSRQSAVAVDSRQSQSTVAVDSRGPQSLSASWRGGAAARKYHCEDACTSDLNLRPRASAVRVGFGGGGARGGGG